MHNSTRLVPLRDITTNPWNPHRMTNEELEALQQSLTEDGQWRAILVIEMDVPDDETETIKAPYRIIDGEHLFRAMTALGYTEAKVLVYGKNSEIPAWKQKEIGQVINHGLRGTIEDPEKTRAIMQELVERRGVETIARRTGLGVEGVRHIALAPATRAAPGTLGVTPSVYEERKTYTVALVFDTAAEMQAFEKLVDAVGSELVDADSYQGRRGKFRQAVLSKSMQLAGESLDAL